MARKGTERQGKKSERKTKSAQSTEHLQTFALAYFHTHTLARLHALTPALILLFLPTILLWSVTFGGKTLAPVDLLLLMSPWRHFAAERFPEFNAVRAPLLDVVQQYFPWRKFYAESLRQGKLPLWNPFMFCGTSFVGNGMSAIFYPLNLLFVAMPIETAFGWVVWIHLVLAGIFMFGFLRQFVSPVAALTGAISFQLCGFFVAWLAYLPLICTAIWLPAALWAFEKGFGTGDWGLARRILFALLAGFALGMALLAGHPQVGFYVLWAFGVYIALRVVVDLVLGTGQWRKSLVFGILTVFCGIAVGAPQLLPLIEMAKISFRSGAEAMEAAAANRLPFDQFVRLFVPSFFGDWRSGTHHIWDFARFNFVERTGYPSVVAFLLAMVGAFSFGAKILTGLKNLGSAGASPSNFVPNKLVTHHSSFATFLSGVVFTIIGVLAASVPIVHRFMALGLPGTQAFVGISRALFLFDFGIAILCAFGVEFLARHEFHPSQKLAPRPASLVPSIALVVALVFMAICVSQGVISHAETAFHPLLQDFTLSQIYRWLIFTALGVFSVFFALRLHTYTPAHLHAHMPTRIHAYTLTRLHSFTLYALPFLVAADLLLFAWSQHPEADREMAFFETPSIRWLKRNLGSQRFVAVGTDAIKRWTPSNTLMVYGLRDAQGSDSLMTMRIFRFLQTWDANSPLHRAFAVRNFDSPLLDLMAVKYVVAAEPLSAEERKSLRLVHTGDLWIYENPDALVRAFVVHHWEWAKSPKEALQKIKAPDFNPQKVAILEDVQDEGQETAKSNLQNLRPSLPSYSRSWAKTHSSSSLVRFSEPINTLRMEVDSTQPAVLIVADGAYPGWRAFGRNSRHQDMGWKQFTVLIANYAFRAVLLSEGKWQVVWVYFPSSIVVGLFLCMTVISATVAVFTFKGG